jgi:type II restriction enzyme
MIASRGRDESKRELDLGFAEGQTTYQSASQSARVLTERWVEQQAFCTNCGNDRLTKFGNNLPVADFFCDACREQFELKAKKGTFGSKVLNGAYGRKIERLNSNTNPNLLLLNYDLERLSVTNLIVIPKYYFVPSVIEKRSPLQETAERAGWVGSNILLSSIPNSGKIFIVKEGRPQPREAVLRQWSRTLFLMREGIEARGWLLEVMHCIESLGKSEFQIEDIYAQEHRLKQLYPENKHVREKIRQQLQVLRDREYLDFVSRGRYRLRGGQDC